MATEQLSRGNDDGTLLGQSSSDKLGFYAITTPIVRPTTGTAVATTAASATSSAFGFTTSSQANAIVTLVNSLKTNLDALGLQG